MSLFKKQIQKALAEVDVEIDGKRPWDIVVHDERLYSRVIMRGSIGLGEAYMDGWWDCADLPGFFFRILRSQLHIKYKAPGQDLFHAFSNLFNRQSVKRSLMVVEKHYDLDNNLYMSFLDPYNQYTCGYFKNTSDLNVAQEQKLDLICRKLQLKKTDKVLDIGCGWGGFAKYAGEHYGCHVTGISISDEQIKYAKEFTNGLPVDILKMDYRNLTGQFDKVLVCGMIEHVGHKNYRRFMEIVEGHLKDDGLFLLHTLAGNFSEVHTDPWIDKYIFPNGIMPTIETIGKSLKGLFVVEDWHNFGLYYDPTLLAWNENFEKSWPELSKKYSERFHRMWNYYLLSCAGAFRARDNQLWQIVLSKGGLLGGYESVR